MKDSNFNPWFHIIYWGIIIVLLGVFIVLVAPTYVTERAMDNISFASAIVSIVLAVVSIVWSIISGHSALNRQNTISSIEGDISQRLVEFKQLEVDIKDALAETGDKVEKVRDRIEALSGAFDVTEGKKKEKTEKGNHAKIDFGKYPIYAVYALYTACVAYNKKHIIDLVMLDSLPSALGNYFAGFWVALDRLYPSVFKFSGDSKGKRLSIVKYDDKVLGDLDSIQKEIKQRGKMEIVSKIDEVLGE